MDLSPTVLQGLQVAGSGSIGNKAFAVLLSHSIETAISAKELGSLQGEAKEAYACCSPHTMCVLFIVTLVYTFRSKLLIIVCCVSD